MNLAGHRELWVLGYEHTDPSLGNLMVNSKGRGVLNDWDLCRVRDRVPQADHQERTGTIPFMALDLLTDKYWNGKIKRLYRHDLEAFVWILPWVFLQYEGRKLSNKPVFERWSSGDYIAVGDSKYRYLHQRRDDDNPMECWKEEWRFACLLLSWLRREEFARVDSADPFTQQPVKDPPSEEATYDDFRRQVEEAMKIYAPLHSMLQTFYN